MAAYSSFFGSPISWIAVVGSFLAFCYSSEFGFIIVLLTTSALVCPVIVSRLMPHQQKSVPRKEYTEEIVVQKDERVSKIEKEAEKKEEKSNGEYLLSSSDALSDSESHEFDQTSSSEDSENDWMIFRENLNQSSTPCSDGSISDEESLIEIALPTSHYFESKRQKWTDCSHFRQQMNWTEMLNEMNEEENFIEIDLFMGNIKSSRFEIEA